MCRWPAPHTIYPALLYTWLGQFWIVCYVTSYCRSYVHLVFCQVMSQYVISNYFMFNHVLSSNVHVTMSSNFHVQLYQCPVMSMSMSVVCIARRKGWLYLLAREHPETESFPARSPQYNGMSEDGGHHFMTTTKSTMTTMMPMIRRRLTCAWTSCL